jgi:hypothetical protein
MEADDAKLKRARQLRLEGKSLREAAKLAGISPTTVRKHERGWIDGNGEIHGGWAGDVGRSDLARVASAAEASKTAAALLDRSERIRLHAEMASMLIDKVREFVPVLKLKNAREAKHLMAEARELAKLIAQDEGRTDEGAAPGVRREVTLEDVQAHYERTRDITPSYIEPAADPDALPEADAAAEPAAGSPVPAGEDADPGDEGSGLLDDETDSGGEGDADNEDDEEDSE